MIAIAKRTLIIPLICSMLLALCAWGMPRSAHAARFIEDVSISNVRVENQAVHARLIYNSEEEQEVVLVAVLYGQNGKSLDVVMQTHTFSVIGETEEVSMTFGKVYDPLSHTIKLFVWNNLQQNEPLSYVSTMRPVDESLRTFEDEFVNPYAFYAGRVARTYSATENQTLVRDLSNDIDTNRQIIGSVTKELHWNYRHGIAEVNTPNVQGATGFLSTVDQIVLKDAVIRSNNEFGTVMLVTLDEQPLVSSRRLLVQAMTTEQPFGFRSEPEMEKGKETGYLTVTDLGSGPMNVEDIETEITLKGIDDVTNVYTLDENGYVVGELTGAIGPDGFTFTLAPDALYTVVERAGVADPYDPSNQPSPEPAVYVWWEGENPAETNFDSFGEEPFPASGYPDTRHLLSNGDWLNVRTVIDSDQVPYVTYDIDVPEDASYQLFVRKFWLHGPFQWRMNDGEWRTVGRDITILDKVGLAQYIEASWVAMGEIQLSSGSNTLEIRLLQEADTGQPNNETVAAFDAFVLSKQPFQPRGTLKPGEKLGLHEDGYWAFEPDVDHFGNSLIDMSFLNEETAGQDGFVTRTDDNLYFANGRVAKFWGINVGTSVTNLERSEVDYLAKRLAKNGVNLVRIHGEIFDENGNIADEALDRYHYFVSAMKREGIYVNLSYYFVLWSDMTQAEDYQEEGNRYTSGNKNPYALLPFHEPMQENYKQGVRKLLETPNPYENQTPLSQEPAVAMIEIQNEDSYLFWTFNPSANFPSAIRKQFFGLFGNWAAAKYGSIELAYEAWGEGSVFEGDDPANGELLVERIWNLFNPAGSAEEPAPEGAAQRRKDTLAFLVESQKGFYEDMETFLKQELGSSSLVVASNWVTADPRTLEALERYTYSSADIVDRHAYYESNHQSPTYWTIQKGDTYKPEATVLHPDKNPVKIVHNDGQPSMISETAWTNPTPYGAEGPYMLSVYGALQGIDALVTFQVSSSGWPMTMEKWPIMTPSMMGQFPAFSLLYRQGYVSEAPNVAIETRTLEDLYSVEGSKIFESLNLDDARK